MSMGKSPVVELRIGNYTVCVKHRLAEGGFGYVDLVFDTSSKVEYVLKRSGIERQEIYEIVKKEISILQRFAGPHVVKLLASDVIVVNKGKKEACLLLELCPGGHLLDRLSVIESKSLSPATLYKIFGQLLLAVKPFHESEPPVTHRDLKLENILFGSVIECLFLMLLFCITIVSANYFYDSTSSGEDKHLILFNLRINSSKLFIFNRFFCTRTEMFVCVILVRVLSGTFLLGM